MDCLEVTEQHVSLTQHGGDLRFRTITHGRRHSFPIFEQHQHGDAGYPKRIASSACSSTLTFPHLDSACVLFCNLVKHGGKHFARPTPCRPEIHQHRLIRTEDLFFKIALCDCNFFHIITPFIIHGSPLRFFILQIAWVIVPMGQNAHHVLGRYSTMTIRPSSRESQHQAVKAKAKLRHPIRYGSWGIGPTPWNPEGPKKS